MQTQLINFSIPTPLLKALDTQAKREVKTRSETIRDAVRIYLLRTSQWERITSYGRKQAKKLHIRESQIEDIVDAYRQGK